MPRMGEPEPQVLEERVRSADVGRRKRSHGRGRTLGRCGRNNHP